MQTKKSYYAFPELTLEKVLPENQKLTVNIVRYYVTSSCIHFIVKYILAVYTVFLVLNVYPLEVVLHHRDSQLFKNTYICTL